VARARIKSATYNHVHRPKDVESVTHRQDVTFRDSRNPSKHGNPAKLDFVLGALNDSEQEAPGSDVALAGYFRVLAGPRMRDKNNFLSRATPAQQESLQWKVATANCFESIRRLMRALAPRPGDAKATSHHRRRAALTADYLRGFADTFSQIDSLRICEICGRWFRPRRVDQKCCSKVCAGTLRVRRHRAQQATYEYNRKLRSAGLRPTKGKN
jgi:hypothetical protein